VLVHEIPREIFASLSQVVNKATALRPEDRFRSVKDVQEALSAVELEIPLPAELERDPGLNAIRKQNEDLLRQVLRSMSSRDREILTRFYLHEQTQEQICADLNLTDTQFRLLKSRAKARFGDLGRKLYGKESPSDSERPVPEDRGVTPRRTVHANYEQNEDLLRQVLRSMSSRDREILTRFYLHEQTQEQICADLNLTDTQFRLLKSRAKARFGDLGRRLYGRESPSDSEQPLPEDRESLLAERFTLITEKYLRPLTDPESARLKALESRLAEIETAEAMSSTGRERERGPAVSMPVWIASKTTSSN